MRLPLAFTLALLLVTSAALPVLADGPGKANGSGRPGERPGATMENTSAEHRTRGPTSIGAFASGDHNAWGEFVSFSYSSTGAQAFTAGGTRLFDLLVESAAPSGRVVFESSGAQVRVRTPGFLLQVHDNPEGVTQVQARDSNVTLSLVPGATLVAVGENAATFKVGNVTGHVRGDALSVSGTTIRVGERLLVFIEASRGAFDTKRQDIGDAIGKGHVGAEGSFNENGSSVAEDVVSYGNVTMRTVRAEHGNVTVQVEGHGTEGRVLVLDIDRELLGADSAGKLHITLDNETIAEESDLQALLDPNADGIHAVYHVVFDPSSNAFQVLVRVPHYSVHTLSVSTILNDVSPSVIIGVLAGAALLVPSAMLLFRKKRE